MQSINMQKTNENTFRGCLSNDFFIDIDLLRSSYCKISYLLLIRVKIWQPTYDSLCDDNSWIHGKCRERFYQTYTKVFKIFSTFCLRFLTCYIFIRTFITSMQVTM